MDDGCLFPLNIGIPTDLDAGAPEQQRMRIAIAGSGLPSDNPLGLGGAAMAGEAMGWFRSGIKSRRNAECTTY